MSSKTPTHRPIPVLKLPKQNGAILTFARAVLNALTNNPNFPNPNPSLATFEANINTFDAAETKAATRAVGAAAARNAAKNQVKDDLLHLCHYVRYATAKLPSAADAAAAIESAFLKVKTVPTRAVPALCVKNTAVSGQVALTARAVAPRAAYEWEHSADQVEWVAAPTTLKASTLIQGLPWAKLHYFRFRALTRAGKSEYSQVVSLLVQ